MKTKCLVVLVMVFGLCAALLLAAQKAKRPRFAEITTNKSAPKPRVQPVVVFREKANQLVVFGGRLESLTPLGDLWTLNLKTREWSRIEPKDGDLRKLWLGIGVYDTKRDRMVVTVPLVEKGIETHWYSFSENKWHDASHSGDIPTCRMLTASVYDPKSDSMVFFGGSAWVNPDNTRYRTVYFNDVYSLSLEDFKWKKLETKGDIPEPRDRHSEIYDPKTGSLLVFGGIGTGKGGSEMDFSNVYSLDLAKAEWKKIETKGIVPGLRSGHCAVYDPVRHRMVVFGGQDDFKHKHYLELLALDLTTYEWSQIQPELRMTLQVCGAAAVWDSVQKRALLFGGSQPGRMHMNSVWELVDN
ncbi:MAG TPA: kelch repeat-containing protein [bacterium]|nr:kelch repeat-containing protein [bacterium]